MYWAYMFIIIIIIIIKTDEAVTKTDRAVTPLILYHVPSAYV
jgi:hypothetical protein